MISRYVIGIGEFIVLTTLEGTIVTHALGSCVAVVVHSKKHHVAGMIHMALPKSNEHALSMKKGYYVDEGLPLFLKQLFSHMPLKGQEVDVTVIGGADAKNPRDPFKIGYHNLKMTEKVLSNWGIKFIKLETGGHESRTVILEVATGDIRINKNQMLI